MQYLCESLNGVFLGATSALAEREVVQRLVVAGRPVQHLLQHLQCFVVLVQAHVAGGCDHEIVVVLVVQRQRLRSKYGNQCRKSRYKITSSRR